MFALDSKSRSEDDLRAEIATLKGRLKALAAQACPDGYAEGYEDAAILSAIQERDDLKRGPVKDGEF